MDESCIVSASPVVGTFFVEWEFPLPWKASTFDRKLVHLLENGRLVYQTTSGELCTVGPPLADALLRHLMEERGITLPANVVQRLEKTTFAGMDEGGA